MLTPHTPWCGLALFAFTMLRGQYVCLYAAGSERNGDKPLHEKGALTSVLSATFLTDYTAGMNAPPTGAVSEQRP